MNERARAKLGVYNCVIACMSACVWVCVQIYVCLCVYECEHVGELVMCAYVYCIMYFLISFQQTNFVQ